MSLPLTVHGQLRCPLRFETLEPEMNALAARISAVNDIAEQLLRANPPNPERIVSTQEQLNHRWARAAPGRGSPPKTGRGPGDMMKGVEKGGLTRVVWSSRLLGTKAEAGAQGISQGLGREKQRALELLAVPSARTDGPGPASSGTPLPLFPPGGSSSGPWQMARRQPLRPP